MNGDSGNDVVYASTYPGSTAAGSYGNDRVDGNGNTSSRLYGNDGNDRVCAALTDNTVKVNTKDGGNGTDKWCGSATNFSGMESRACAECTLF